MSRRPGALYEVKHVTEKRIGETNLNGRTLESVEFKESHKRTPDVEKRYGNLIPADTCSVLNHRRILVCRHPQRISKHKQYKCQAVRKEDKHDNKKSNVYN